MIKSKKVIRACKRAFAKEHMSCRVRAAHKKIGSSWFKAFFHGLNEIKQNNKEEKQEMGTDTKLKPLGEYHDS